MGRIASSEYHTVELHADNEEEEEPIHAEVILPVASKVATFNQQQPSSASELAQELTWADTFYEDEPDIVAVFDLDQNAISFYQRRAFYFAVYCTVGLWFLAGLYYSLDFQPVAIFFVCLSMGYVLMASKTWAKVQAATSSRNGGGIHIAISSLSVRYDQADPMVSTEVSRLSHVIRHDVQPAAAAASATNSPPPFLVLSVS